MIPTSVIDIDTRNAVPEALEEFRAYITKNSRIIARDIARYRPFAEDLAQEAAIALWEIDPTRFDADDVEYVRGVLYKRMQTVARLELRLRGGKRDVIGGL
jgi:DNA-directed RNA polymerase specialized sigma24 family protein